MPVPTNGLSALNAKPAVRGLLIVARDHVALYQSLQHAFGDSEEIAVLFDRRRGDRRRGIRAVTGDRRRSDRRCLSHIGEDPRTRQYVLVRPRYRRPSD